MTFTDDNATIIKIGGKFAPIPARLFSSVIISTALEYPASSKARFRLLTEDEEICSYWSSNNNVGDESSTADKISIMCSHPRVAANALQPPKVNQQFKLV